MHAKHVGALLVRRGKEYIGIITETDLARKVVALGLDLETTPISSVMNKPILSMDCMSSNESGTGVGKFLEVHLVYSLCVNNFQVQVKRPWILRFCFFLKARVFLFILISFG